MRFDFFQRPLPADISDLSEETEKAFVNILPFAFSVWDGDGAQADFVAPALFISDGMSVPHLARSSVSGEDGISAGHLHDILYSETNSLAEKLGKFLGQEPRAAADEAMRAYLRAHCPGFDGWDIKKSHAAVRLFGGDSFRDSARDDWRRRVAGRIFGGLPGNGCGVADILPHDAAEVYGNLRRRR